MATLGFPSLWFPPAIPQPEERSKHAAGVSGAAAEELVGETAKPFSEGILISLQAKKNHSSIALWWGLAHLPRGEEGALRITASHSERGEIQAF